MTPTPDIVTQMLMASPMFVLYELSIFIAKVVYKKKEEQSKQEEEEEEASQEDTAADDEELL